MGYFESSRILASVFMFMGWAWPPMFMFMAISECALIVAEVTQLE